MSPIAPETRRERAATMRSTIPYKPSVAAPKKELIIRSGTRS